jgi:membrane-bound lytic murein transglycosylase B
VLLALPAPNAPVPRTASALVQALGRDESRLAVTIDGWRLAGPPPRDVTLLALYRQRIVRSLDQQQGSAVVRLVPRERDDVQAHLDLKRLAATSPPVKARIRVGPPAPALQLLSWYREGEKRFKVRWQLLAAVNFVESAFGKIRNVSTAGAQGPMQFVPATWRAYGLGGNVRDPHDAILGAANYLSANGAAHDERAALLHYNHSTLYADAVLHYAHRIAHVSDAFAEYYAWQVFVRTPSGYRRVTGPR